jgi:hypothetical protein
MSTKTRLVERSAAVRLDWRMRFPFAALDRLACAGSNGRVVRVQAAPSHTPLVTVVVPCYNYGDYLPGCVAAILEQPGVAVDVLVVDDASTDASGEIAEQLAAEHESVRLIRHERNAGHIATYNEGLALARGEYVVLLSADDLLTPGSLQRATALMEAHPSVGLVYGHAVRFADEVPPPARVESSHWMIWSGYDWLATRFRSGRNCILSPEVVLRTGIQHEIGGYKVDLPHTGDLEVWMRAAAVADIGYVGGVDQAWYRDHASNMHRSMFQASELGGMAVDLRERMRAFELMARQVAGRFPEAERWLSEAQRALAVETLNLCIRPFYWGNAGTWPVDQLADLALELYPGARRLPQWRTLSLHRRLGPGRPRRDPLSISHELILRACVATRQWRWAQAGI